MNDENSVAGEENGGYIISPTTMPAGFFVDKTFVRSGNFSNLAD